MLNNTITVHPFTLNINNYIFKLITLFIWNIKSPNIITNGYGSAFY